MTMKTHGNSSSSTSAAVREKVSDLKHLIGRVPREEDGYCTSFEVDDDAHWVPFLQEYGFVVVRLLTPEECHATRDEFFNVVNQLPPCDPGFLEAEEEEKKFSATGKNGVVDGEAPKLALPKRRRPLSYDDPASWDDGNWPERGKKLVQHPAVSPWALRNRTHPKLYQLFHRLHGGVTQRLFANVDVWGVMRGTSGLCAPEDATPAELSTWQTERPEWRNHLNPHWDTNPRTYVEATRSLPTTKQEKGETVVCSRYPAGMPPPPGKKPLLYQGVLALVDCDDTVGGFAVVPCSSPQLHRWVAAVPPPPAGTFVRPNHLDATPHDPWTSKGMLQNVPIRQGEYVVFCSGTLHGNYANSGPNMRLVQYMRLSTDMGASGVGGGEKDDPQWNAHLPFPGQLQKKWPGLRLDECAAATRDGALDSCPTSDGRTTPPVSGLSDAQLRMLGLLPYPGPTAPS